MIVWQSALKLVQRSFCSLTVSRLPKIEPRQLEFYPKFQEPREVWVENFNTFDEEKLGLIHLHPDVFAVNPRIDIIHQNVRWQRMYRYVSFAHTKSRAEVRGGGRKPWRQKGTGRARHGSIRSPLWRGGGIAHGPRSPKSYFYMLPFHKRVLGLRAMLSIKLAQDDLHIIDKLEIPTDDPKFIEELITSRNWGPSVLFVDRSDVMPRNITIATDSIPHVNLMPAYGLNVYSMLKHCTLVLTLDAVEHIEKKILEAMRLNNDRNLTKKFRPKQQ